MDSTMFDEEISPQMTVFQLLEEEKAEKEAANDTIDYTVLSVAVATLALILIVELVRNKMDHAAVGRPFFHTVLTSVNSELATLGIVEFVVFLIQKYYAGLDKAQKEVFTDVHFMLFYCALFNALQSVLLAVSSYSVANHLWVQTESLELDHYVEIREEFDRVDCILYGNERQQSTPEFLFEYNVWGIRKLWQRIYRCVRYPILSQRHADLLVQVRFHDLRVHFLKANDLPLQLKVSDYLKRSLLSVLQKLTHISAAAWLLLTGCICLLYFFMGIVIYVTEDLNMVGVSLTWIYFCSMVFFVVLSLVIYNKMNWIFQRIMRMKLMASHGDTFKSGLSIRRGEKEVQNQSDLFWGGNPDYVAVIIQFAQFGFALALALLLVFWDDINVKGVPVASWTYLFTVFACYAAFVAIMAQVIPRYTLCTNLGQLVNKTHLQEILGQYYLEQAEHKRQLWLEEQEDENYELETFDDMSALSKESPSTFGSTVANARIATTKASSKQETPTLLAELVQMDTDSLRFALPNGPQSIRRQQERKLLRKTESDGAALMRSTTGKPPEANVPVRPSRAERKKSNSASDAIRKMKDAQDIKPIPRTRSGPSLRQLADSQFDAIDDQQVTLAPGRYSNYRCSKTLSQNSAPLPPLNETTDEEIEVAVHTGDKKDPLVGSPAAVSHPEEPNCDSDDQSDIEDVPQVHSQEHDPDDHDETFYDVVTNYFLGPKYPVVSAIFGTLICFWVVGQRVEELLIATGALPDSKNTFQFPLNFSFWWEATYLCCFIVASSFVTVAFAPRHASSNKERTMSLAGFLDCALAGACLALLMVAEGQRCYCVEEDNNPDCCPQFGSRSYGGLGDIEPFTSLIVLRLFRFWIAKRIVCFLDKYTKWSSKDAALKKAHHVHHDNHDHGHSHGDPRELAKDVWKRALCLYPDVAEEHGVFSTQLLQTMLGVDVGDGKSISHNVVKSHADETVTLDANDSADEASAKNGDYLPRRVRQSLDRAQSSNIVLGKTINSMIAKNEPVSSVPLAPLKVSEDSISDEFTFFRPKAKLLRSMRRCHRKLLPLINTWTAVDVVITKYEIVYFQAFDIADLNKTTSIADNVLAMETGRQALEATTGGKGLCLKDVAKGRKVVGHLAISAVDNVHVDRILPHQDKKQDEDGSSERHDELWEPNEQTQDFGLTSEARWAHLKEDRLMIHSNHGTLCFRFESDLLDMEANRDRSLSEHEGSLHKGLALLWCQTIGRACKRAQLKQKLKHYGNGDDEELRDYLHVIDPKNDGYQGVMGKIHRRASSAIDLLPKPRLHRGNSIPTETEDEHPRSPIAHPRLRRGSSVPTLFRSGDASL